MVAPLLAVLGGVGLLAGRSLISGRLQANQLADLMASQRETLDTLLGPTLAGNQGPQQQPALAGSLLTDDQVDTANAMAAQGLKGSRAAQDFILQAGKNNRAAFVKDRQFGLDMAKFDQSVSSFKANEKQRELENAVALQGRTTTENTRLESIAALDDRDLAERIAAREGKTTIQVRNPQGGFVEVPTTGSTAHQAGVDNLRSTTKTLRQVNDVVDDFRSGSVQDPASPIGARQQISYQFALAELRKLLGTGTPQAAELELFERTFPDPQSLINALTKGDVAATAGWQKVQEIARTAQRQAGRDARFLRLDPEDVQRAGIEARRAEFAPQDPGQATLDPNAQVSSGVAGNQLPIGATSQLSTHAALRAAQLADLVGLGSPQQVELLKQQRAVQEEQGAPIFPAQVGQGFSLITDLVSRGTDAINIFR